MDGGKRPLRERRRRALVRLAILLVLLLSPLGAAAPGFLLAWGCDINFFSSAAQQCFVPQPLLDYFTGMFFVALTPGSFVIAILWLVLAGGLFLAFLAYAVMVAWLYGVARETEEAAIREDGAVL